MNAQRQQVVPAHFSFIPVPSGLLQRKCACGNHTMAGGECEECSKKKPLGLQTKLQVNEPGDSYEQEADRIADQVMAAPVRSTLSGAPPRIQRFSGQSSGQMGAAPASVDHALACPGRLLEPALRQDMEQRFGYDFSHVRVHSGTAAAQSARDVNAHAYTVGQDIVFGASRFAPGTQEGRRLLAHELAHTTQAGRPGANRIIHRRGAVTARPAAPAIYNYWRMPGYSGSAADQAYLNRLGAGNAVVAPSGPSGRAVAPSEVCTDIGRGTDWGACAAYRESQAHFRVRQRIRTEEAERPHIVLMRGGSASDAFIKKGTQTTATFHDRPSYTYTPRFFHVIDAMEHDFDLSTSYVGDRILYMLYFPELQHPKIEGFTQADVEFLTRTARARVTFDPDPQSVPERLKALQQILNRRVARIRARVRKMQEERLLAEAETATLTHKGKQRLEGACDWKTVERKGGHDRHDTYAKHVGKEKGYGNVKRELQYTTPEGVSYSFDVYNPANKSHVWEVKTMHDWAGPDKIAIAPRIVRDKNAQLPNMSERIASLESQRLKGLYVATRCGLVFRYAFDNCEAYRGFKQQWILPPLEYIPYPGERKEVCSD
ncbi:MAG TPA: DUF4157 domain-containing protein [Patescibacteria group bacterium]|nr:DUF4157 domain-containing protein [Patescibacteria group bacterium]